MLPFENQPNPAKPDPAEPDSAAATPSFAQFQPHTQIPGMPNEGQSGSAWGIAFRSVGVTVLVAGVVGALLMSLSLRYYQSYGVTLFCLSPLICSCFAVVMDRNRQSGQPKGVWLLSGAVVAVLAMLTSMLLLVFTKGEGIICVLMALPFAFVMALLGGLLAWP